MTLEMISVKSYLYCYEQTRKALGSQRKYPSDH